MWVEDILVSPLSTWHKDTHFSTKTLFKHRLMATTPTLLSVLALGSAHGEIWDLVVDYAYSSIIDMHNLKLVSKFFAANFNKGNLVTKVVRRNFVALLKQFIRPACVPGSEEHVIGSLFCNFLDRPDISYVISGGFALASLLRADLESNVLTSTDIDIFLTLENISIEEFTRQWQVWLHSIIHLDLLISSDGHSIFYQLRPFNRIFTTWSPPQTYHYIHGIASWRIPWI